MQRQGAEWCKPLQRKPTVLVREGPSGPPRSRAVAVSHSLYSVLDATTAWTPSYRMCVERLRVTDTTLSGECRPGRMQSRRKASSCWNCGNAMVPQNLTVSGVMMSNCYRVRGESKELVSCTCFLLHAHSVRVLLGFLSSMSFIFCFAGKPPDAQRPGMHVCIYK